MKYRATTSTEEYNGCIAATKKALLNEVKAVADELDKNLRGVYYESTKDPFTEYTFFQINAWLS